MTISSNAILKTLSTRNAPCLLGTIAFGIALLKVVNMRKRKYLSGKIRKEVWLRFNKRCAKCGCETSLFGNTVSPFHKLKPGAVDHIIPFSKGGECSDNNFQWLCISCNARKGAK